MKLTVKQRSELQKSIEDSLIQVIANSAALLFWIRQNVDNVDKNELLEARCYSDLAVEMSRENLIKWQCKEK